MRLELSRGRAAALVMTGAVLAGIVALRPTAPAPASAAESTAALPRIVEEKCLSCHAVDNGPNRITQMRKSPEGWEATIRRMQRLRGVELTEDDVSQLVKALSDTRGLSPAEAKAVEDWAVADPTTYMARPKQLEGTCLQCHSAGRPLAQYRTEQEWQRLKDFHLGMDPSIPLQGESRFVNWAEEATKSLSWLATENPLNTDTWQAWQTAQWPAADGDWLVAGTEKGKGAFSGTMRLEKTGEGEYRQSGRLTYMDGHTADLGGTVRVYTGFWGRASTTAGADKLRGYYLLAADGQSGDGDWIGAENTSLRAHLTLRRPSAAGVLQVSPSAVQAGAKAVLRIAAAGVGDAPAVASVQIGPGVQVTSVQPVTDGTYDVSVEVASDAAPGSNTFSFGSAGGGHLTVYRKVDYIKVTPEDPYSRIGAANGSHPTPVQFEAIGYEAGPDGKQGTDDDLNLGPVTAQWSLAEYQVFPEDTVDDLSFVGNIDKNGLFTPAAPGPNSKRDQQNNNTGTVQVNAVYRRADGTELKSQTTLLVTSPHWRDVH